MAGTVLSATPNGVCQTNPLGPSTGAAEVTAHQFIGLALAALVANEVRGAIMAAPVLWAMWHTGGTWMHAWLLLCLAGSVVVPVWIWRRMRERAL